MATRLGDRVHHVQIQQNTAVQTDDAGEPEENWETVAHRYAEIEPLTGREYFSAQQVGANVDYKFTMRYYPITPDMRLVWQGRTFNVGTLMNPGEQANGTDTVVMGKEHRPSTAGAP